MKRMKSISSIAGVIGIGVAAYVFAKFQGSFVSWFIFYMLLPFVLYSILLFFYPLSDLKVERKMTTRRLTREGKVTIRLRITRKLPFPLLYTVITDRREHAERERITQEIVLWGFKRQHEFSYTLTNIQRGEYTLKAVEIETVDFFNWIKKRRVFAIKDSFLVYPKLTELFYQSASSSANEGKKASAYSLTKDAAMPSGVREYAPGDRMSWIHWKSFARTNKLMTKEFDEQKSEQYTVLLDANASPDFEEGLEFAASLLVSAKDHHAMLTLLIAGKNPAQFPMIHSAESTQQALIHLAKMQPDETNHSELPRLKVDQGNILLVVTGNLRLEFIQTVLQSYPNPSSIVCFVTTTEVSEELQSVIQQVKQLGIKVQLISKANISSALKEAVTS
ncbi:DUF58 domain-containing protein [Sporosarcina sp.]|uniref:DUF58 domain-containing protein n=1 Tax=Sporosarcina sp. TaxID=49982 RepID=UPI00262D5A01|nr:DUF58 domain-containing protein [Sporosarcina sp.]